MKPDKIPLDRMNGEEVPNFINDMARRNKFLSILTGRQIARMIRVYPVYLKTRQEIVEWMGDKWYEFEGVGEG